MNASIETLQQQVGEWEHTSTTNQTTLETTIETLTQDVEQSQNRVGVYGDQVTALVDQIDQNNRQYDTLLTQFQDALIEFKGTMGEFTATLTTERDRATQEEERLASQLGEQRKTLDRVMPTAKEILDIQKRLNQLHGYINQVRDTVTSDTATLQTTLKNEAPDDLRKILTSLEQRFQLAQVPSSSPALADHLETLEQRVEESEKLYTERVKALNEDIQKISLEKNDDDKTQEIEHLHTLVTSLEQRYRHLEQTASPTPSQDEHLQALEQRVEESERLYAEKVNTLNEDIQKISIGMNNNEKTQEMDNLQAAVISLEQRYQQLAQTPSSNPRLTENLQALEQRMKESEKHYAETVKGLHGDIKELSVGVQSGLTTPETEKLQSLVASLEQRYQQLAHDPSANTALSKHLQALEHRVQQSEIQSATTIKALQDNLQTVSARMATLTQSIGAETVEALHHDIQEVSLGMLKLAQSISHLEQTKIQTKPIQAGSIIAPRDRP